VDGAAGQGRFVSATIRNPTTETLKNLTRGASDAIKSHPGTILQNVTAALGLSDCSDVEGRLQDSAVHDAELGRNGSRTQPT